MSPRNRSTLMSLFFTLTAAGVMIYIFAWRESALKKDSAFQIEDVVEFQWTANDDVKTFKITSPHVWIPQVAAPRINEKLWALSHLKLSPSQTPTEPQAESIQVQLKFRNNESWAGVYSKHYFVWTEGPKKFQGSALTENELRLFQEGQFAFSDLNWSWCPDKVKKIIVEYNEEVFEILQSTETTGWRIHSLDNEEKYIPDQQMQKWFNDFCHAKVVAWHDLNIESSGLDDGSIEIHFANGKSIEYEMSQSVFQIDDQKAAVSPQLYSLLQKLLDL